MNNSDLERGEDLVDNSDEIMPTAAALIFGILHSRRISSMQSN